jgi:uncharacterized membrane protein
MQKSKLTRILTTLSLVVILLCSFSITGVMAADETPTPTPTPTPTLAPDLKLTCDIPSYAENTATSFYYNINVSYSGNDTVTVNLSSTPPQGWNSTITYSSKQVTSIPIGPLTYNSPDTKTISLSMSPNAGNSPTPGEYKMSFKATAGDMVRTLELTALIKTKYVFSLNTANGNLAMTSTAGKENTLALEMYNTGSGDLNDITLTSSKPDDWVVKFEPEKIDLLAAGQKAQVNVIVTPPKDKTIAGDYNISLTASNSNVSSYITERVTVEVPTIWGTVAIIVIVVVIVGLAFLFLKLGRR